MHRELRIVWAKSCEALCFVGSSVLTAAMADVLNDEERKAFTVAPIMGKIEDPLNIDTLLKEKPEVYKKYTGWKGLAGGVYLCFFERQVRTDFFYLLTSFLTCFLTFRKPTSENQAYSLRNLRKFENLNESKRF